MRLKTLISCEALQARVAELAQEISEKEKVEVLVGVLTGSFIFVADLARAMRLADLRIQFVRASSYGNGTEHSSFSINK